MIFGFFILPETVTDRIRRPFSWRRANPLGAFASVSALPGIGRLVVVFFFYQVAFFVYPAVWAYYSQARFGWGPGMIGLSLAAFGVSIAFVQGWLIRVILSVFGDRRTVIYGMAVNFCGFLAFALVTNGTLALVLAPITALGAVVMPALQGIMSRTVPDNSQGELQGVLTSTGALATILSPLIMTAVFSAFTSAAAPFFMPGAPFVVSMLLMVVCAGVFLGRGAPRTA
jgi:DHA1 family tetracycline resistance protein-like MFS transporter